jgi:hypothetical protein
MKPWTWDELRKIKLGLRFHDNCIDVIDDANGRRYKAFLKKYGLRGALALDLSVDTYPPYVSHGGGLHCSADGGGFVRCKDSCPLRDSESCTTWSPNGRAAMTDWYRREIEEHGLGAEGER